MERAVRRAFFGGGALLGLVALAAAVAAPSAATLTPPPTGDWTIDSGENALLSAGVTVVAGNITVRGTLTVDNATLQLDPPAPGVVPRVLVEGAAAFTLDHSTLRGGPSALDGIALDATPGATLALRSSVVQGLGSTARGGLALVGAHLDGAQLSMYDSRVDSSDGGIGLEGGSALSAENVSITVRSRALYMIGNSTAQVDRFTAEGNISTSDFLVLVDRSTLRASNSTFVNATTLLLLLSSEGSFTNATFERAARTALLLVGSDLAIEGGTVAPRAISSIGVEAYGSSMRLSARFQNYTFGIASLGSTVEVHGSSFVTSNTTPKSSFAGLYAFDTAVEVSNSTFNGMYHVTDIPLRDGNGTIVVNATTGLPELVPVFDCSNSALWLVRSDARLADVATECFNEHYHGEDGSTWMRSVAMVNGTTGANFFRGTVDAFNLTASNFTNPSGTAVALSFYTVQGTVRKVAAGGNDVGAEFRGSGATLAEFEGGSPGLGVRVVNGAPTVTDSTFRIHNETAVQVLGGAPSILNSTFWLTADRRETFGVEVLGGEPLIAGNSFHGVFPLTYGVRVDAGPARVEGNTFEKLERGAQFYSTGFLAANNTFRDCWNGAEARPGSVGTIRGNTFVNLTSLGYGTGVNVYLGAPLVLDNTFTNVNYGIKVLESNTSLGASTRIQGNRFEQVTLYAIEFFNSSRPVLVDNNTIRNASRGGIEVIFSEVVSAYNVIYDAQAYGYEATLSNLTIIGGRLENLSEGIHANQSTVVVQYTTFLLNHIGMIVQDAPARIYNSSFQFNGIAAEFVSNQSIEVVDSIFVGNVEAILAFGSADVLLRDTNFVGTLDYILKNDQASTGSILFTRRGEMNGGRFLLRGVFESTAEALTLRALKMQFASPLGVLPGASIRGASSLTMNQVSLANSTVAFFFEIEDCVGSLIQVAVRGAVPSLARPGEGPYIARSALFLKDVTVNESAENLTAFEAVLTASNLTLRDNDGAGLVMRASSLNGTALAVLDNALCGVVASGLSVIHATNLTVRGNAGGSLCLNAARAEVIDGDFSSGTRDLDLTGGSDVLLVSTTVIRGWRVADTSRLSIAWILDIRVSYPNALLLPSVVVSIIDSKGLATLSAPSTTGRVGGLAPFVERVVTASSTDVRTPYTVAASIENASASALVSLTQDRLVQLDLADREAPQVVIEAPADGTGFAASSVTLRFRASDGGSGVAELQYRFGAGSFTAVPPSSTVVEVTRDVVDGDHTFAVRAVDFGGNSREVSVNFTVDTRAPLITLVSPRFPANVTRAETITVQVTVEPDVISVIIGGVPAELAAGSASRTFELPEGQSNVVVEARDRVGNLGTLAVYMFADRTAPELTLEYASNTTAESFIVVRGRVEPGSQVLIGNTAVPTDNGTFEVLVFLEEGKNNLEVRARDGLQNENINRFTITRGVLQPSRVLDIVAELAGVLLLVGAAALFYLFYRRGVPPAAGEGRGGEQG